MKKIERINPMTNSKKKIDEIKNEPDTFLKAIHEAIVKRNIPEIHESDPLAIIFKNPSDKVQDPIDHIYDLRKYFKDHIRDQE